MHFYFFLQGQGQGQGQGSQTPLFTLQQSITIIDARLTRLESYNKERDLEVDGGNENMNDEYMDELENRLMMMTEEMSNMKQTLLSLQTYTMDVNKVLMEDRLSKM